eukprot:31157-Pelagococcus_subviridis.AAC.6
MRSSPLVPPEVGFDALPLRLSDVLSDVLAIARASKSAALSIAPGPPGMGGIGGAPPPPPPPPPSMARRSSPLGAVPGGADPRGERAGMTPPLPPLRAPMRPAPGMGGPIPGGGPGDDPAPAPPKKAARGSLPPAKIPDAPPPIGDGARCSFRLPVDECSECVIDAGERRLPSDASKNPSSAEPSPPPLILLPPPALPLVVRGMRCRATGGDGFAGEPPPAPQAPPTPSIAINPAAPPAAGGGAVRDCDCVCGGGAVRDCDCVCGGGGPSRIPGGAPRNPCCCCCCCAGIPPLPPNRGSPPAIELTCFSSMRSASKNASDDAADVAAVAAAACAAFAPAAPSNAGCGAPPGVSAHSGAGLPPWPRSITREIFRAPCARSWSSTPAVPGPSLKTKASSGRSKPTDSWSMIRSAQSTPIMMTASSPLDVTRV